MSTDFLCTLVNSAPKLTHLRLNKCYFGQYDYETCTIPIWFTHAFIPMSIVDFEIKHTIEHFDNFGYETDSDSEINIDSDSSDSVNNNDSNSNNHSSDNTSDKNQSRLDDRETQIRKRIEEKYRSDDSVLCRYPDCSTGNNSSNPFKPHSNLKLISFIHCDDDSDEIFTGPLNKELSDPNRVRDGLSNLQALCWKCEPEYMGGKSADTSIYSIIWNKILNTIGNQLTSLHFVDIIKGNSKWLFFQKYSKSIKLFTKNKYKANETIDIKEPWFPANVEEICVSTPKHTNDSLFRPPERKRQAGIWHDIATWNLKKLKRLKVHNFYNIKNHEYIFVNSAINNEINNNNINNKNKDQNDSNTCISKKAHSIVPDLAKLILLGLSSFELIFTMNENVFISLPMHHWFSLFGTIFDKLDEYNCNSNESKSGDCNEVSLSLAQEFILKLEFNVEITHGTYLNFDNINIQFGINEMFELFDKLYKRFTNAMICVKYKFVPDRSQGKEKLKKMQSDIKNCRRRFDSHEYGLKNLVKKSFDKMSNQTKNRIHSDYNIWTEKERSQFILAMVLKNMDGNDMCYSEPSFNYCCDSCESHVALGPHL